MIKNSVFFFLFTFWTACLFGQTSNGLVQLSKDFIQHLQDGKDPKNIVASYKVIPVQSLKSNLKTKEEKLAFWFNTYNGFVIHKLKTNPSSFEDKGAFYKDRNMNIAGIMMSFDDIEHGIIRNNRCKLSYGHWGNPFSPDWIDDLKNEDIDGRAHFSLNCGAKSCPPVATFDDTRINEQMDILTTNYLKRFSEVDGKKVVTTPLFGWFRGDFGDISGIKEYLVRYGIIPETKDYKVIFGDYDWTLMIDNYTDI